MIFAQQINAYLLENFWEERPFVFQTLFELYFQGNELG